ncbi:hypothetical protein acsn021_05080 [Anaerocolumna cellulosilytica]|uniref:Flagellar hook-associated protein 2 n=1 Tax=Anaerocolumna cellulosilytica TaxID=433286 RepID=A0A6S6QV37_9FIRM|nr:flagellar filament capping protein FliD [Anaerocolumna cellulosilytica]MBB5195725.1 flagellar hook-associated protein 2 [Anaerocolumna cellulosilytica]BCJ92939.1 hypothetical protein acsn021_05080 [Anaerocolumna cellulosilytica]
MAVRMTGLISGMDTESLIKELVNAQKLKNKKVSDKLVKSEWKEEKWKELNTKLFKLYNESLSKMRLQGSYLTKKVSSSNENVLEATGNANSAEGSHVISDIKLASAQYVTSGVIKHNGENATGTTKLKDIGIGVETLVRFTNGNKVKTLEVTKDTTIDDLVKVAQSAGLTANFDKSQGRLFISSKYSGEDNTFGITASTSTATSVKNNILDSVGYSTLSTKDKGKVDSALIVLTNDTSVQADIDVATKILADYAEAKTKRSIENTVDQAIRAEITPVATTAEEENIRTEVLEQQIVLIKEEARKNGATEEEINAITKDTLTEEQLAAIQTKQDEKITASSKRIKAAVETKVAEAIAAEKEITPDNRYTKAIEDNQTAIDTAVNEMENLASTFVTNSKIPESDANALLQNLQLDALDKDGKRISTGTSLSTIVAAENSQVKYNGVVITGTSNTISVNGLTLNLKGDLPAGQSINLTVSNNVDANYDMVKNFIKSYNELLAEMNKLYYADSSRGYDPLSDEEKEAMSDDQIEKWESKIKDSGLRRDSSLGSLLDAMKTAMMSSVEVNGKKFSLASFGVETSTDYTEKGLLHIYGNSEDSVYSQKTDKLKKALTENPEDAIAALSGIFQNLYDTVYDKTKAIPNVRSVFTAYNDKLIDKEQTDYKKKIKVLEKKLTEMENRYYKQFSAMETALAKLQSQSNSLAGLFGSQ